LSDCSPSPQFRANQVASFSVIRADHVISNEESLKFPISKHGWVKRNVVKPLVKISNVFILVLIHCIPRKLRWFPSLCRTLSFLFVQLNGFYFLRVLADSKNVFIFIVCSSGIVLPFMHFLAAVRLVAIKIDYSRLFSFYTPIINSCFVVLKSFKFK
jgi:hypothetical protein